MTKASDYRVLATLRDGRGVEIRAERPSDRDAWLAAFRHVSVDTLYHRFFVVKHEPSEQEVEFFLNIDFVNHVALVALTRDGDAPRIVGVARYVMVRPRRAEIAFTVDDDFQGKGLGAAMMRALTEIARDAGLEQFVAEVFAENASMLKVFAGSGLDMTTKSEGSVVHVSLRLPTAIAARDAADAARGDPGKVT